VLESSYPKRLAVFAPAEGIHGVFGALRPWFAPDVVAIPSSYRIVVALAEPAYLRTEPALLSQVEGLDVSRLGRGMRSRVRYHRVLRDELRSGFAEGSTTRVCDWCPACFEAEVVITVAGAVTGIVCGFVAELSDVGDPSVPQTWRPSRMVRNRADHRTLSARRPEVALLPNI
jgi:hypothetical protein